MRKNQLTAEEKAKYHLANERAGNKVNKDSFVKKSKTTLNKSESVRLDAEACLKIIEAEIKKIEMQAPLQPSSSNDSVKSNEDSTKSITKNLMKNNKYKLLSSSKEKEQNLLQKLMKHQKEISGKLEKLKISRENLLGAEVVYEADRRNFYQIKEFKKDNLQGEYKRPIQINPLGKIGEVKHDIGKFFMRNIYHSQCSTLLEELTEEIGSANFLLKQKCEVNLQKTNENSNNNNTNLDNVTESTDTTNSIEIESNTSELKSVETCSIYTEPDSNNTGELANDIETSSVSSENSNGHGISSRVSSSPALSRQRSFVKKRGSDNSDITSDVKIHEIHQGTPLEKTRGMRSGSLGHISEQLTGIKKSKKHMLFNTEERKSVAEIKEFFETKYTQQQ